MHVSLFTPRLAAQPFGEQTYIAEVISHVLKLAPMQWNFEIVTTGLQGKTDHLNRLAAIDISDRAQHRIFAIPQSILEYLYNQINSSIYPLFNRADVVHNFNAQLVPPKTRNLVQTIQDLGVLRGLETSSTPELRSHLTASFKYLKSRAQALITISEFSKNEIIELLDWDPDQITVIGNGVDHDHFFPLQDSESKRANQLLDSLSIMRPYLLHIGGSAPRKNLAMLVRAFTQLKTQRIIPHSLVIAGMKNPSQEVAEAIGNSSAKNEILTLGYLSRSDLRTVLQCADMLVFPSTYEGFGLPPLEAMACGVPVALSNAASLPEVGGDAAIYFEPTELSSITEAISRLANDSTLKAEKTVQGLARAQQCSWNENAHLTLELYKKILH